MTTKSESEDTSSANPYLKHVRHVDTSVPKFKSFKKRQTVRAKIQKQAMSTLKSSSGDRVNVIYRTYFYGGDRHGQLFDSYTDKSAPFSFRIGFHEVSSEWEAVVCELTVGTSARLFVSDSVSHMYHCALAVPCSLMADITVLAINDDSCRTVPFEKGVCVIQPLSVKKLLKSGKKKKKKKGSAVETEHCESTDCFAAIGDVVTVKYKGLFHGGTKHGCVFDSSDSFSFKHGMGKVIKGLDAAVGFVPKKAGHYATLEISSDFGYGLKGTPDKTIPPNQDLVFELCVLDIQKL